MQKKEIDMLLVILIGILILWGLSMIASVSVYPSILHTTRIGLEPDTAFFLKKTFENIILWFLAMIIFTKTPYQILEKFTPYIYFWSIFLLLIVLFKWEEYNGATGWLNIPWLPSIQPVEFAKLGLIIMLAYFIKKRYYVMNRFIEWCVAFFIYVVAILWLLAFQPDFWSILIIAPITLLMYFVAWGNAKFLGIMFLVAFIGAILVYFIGSIKTIDDKWKEIWNKFTYISNRIDNFFRDDLEIASTKTKKDSDYQLRQWFIAMGSGWFFGLWFGESIQKHGYLPEVQWDFIFSIIIEEFWFVWWLVLMGLYLAIAYRWFLISRSVKDLFAKYLAFGITSWFVIQAFINIWVNMNVVPLTGVTLPFVSYGGSSILSLCIATWILLSISRHMTYRPQNLSDALQAKRKVIF